MDKITPFPNTNVIEEQACEWIIKFEGDSEPSATEIEQFNAWLKQNPVHKKVLLEIASNWNDMDVMAGLMIPMGQSMEPERRKSESWALAPMLVIASMLHWLARPLRRLARPVVGIPALALILSLGLSYQLVDISGNTPDNVYITALGQHSTHTLEDGSIMWLNSNSRVEVLFTLNKRLINLIEGEVHFQVEPDPNRPFEVYAGNRMVKAVGTAFSVYRLKDKIEVMVTEGKVDLAVVKSTLIIAPGDSDSVQSFDLEQYESNDEGTVRVLTSLEAGQSAAIPVTSSQLDVPVVEHEPGELARKLSWLEGRLVFAGESLEEVVAEVSRHTPIVIEVNDPELKKLRIGGQFQAGETEALFDVLESGFGIEINKLSEGHVQLNAK